MCVSGKDVNVHALKLSEENWSDLFSSSKHVKNAINNSTNLKKTTNKITLNEETIRNENL